MKSSLPVRCAAIRIGICGVILAFAPAIQAGPLQFFRTWQSNQAADQAQKALDAKKYEEAVLAAKRALQLDGNNVKAVSIMVAIAKHASPSDALRWEQRLAELQPSSNAWLDVAETAVATRDVKTGLDALSKVADTDKNLRYYRAAAGLSMLKNDRKAATEAYQKALQQPGSDASER
jgi:tetratricopeptide (TPR) repeat protein